MILLYFIFVLEIKHYFADWVWQSMWMVTGKRLKYPDYIKPLAAHAGIHALLMTWAVLLFFGLFKTAVPLYLLVPIIPADFVSHFIIDRCKALYWDTRFGLVIDQVLHYLFYVCVLVYVFHMYHSVIDSLTNLTKYATM